VKWTINSSGKITVNSPKLKGNLSASSNGYVPIPMDPFTGTMTLSKNFIAGTQTMGSNYALQIVQKMVPGNAYSNADIRGKSFAFHGLQVGDPNAWNYGTGTTDTAGVVNFATSVLPPAVNGGIGPTGDIGTLSVDSNGFVTISGNTTFQGFLSDDRKTIVATEASEDGYRMMIIQVSGQTYESYDKVGTWYTHMLNADYGASFGASEIASIDFRAFYETYILTNGYLNIANWQADPGASAPNTTSPYQWIAAISTTGIMTITTPPPPSLFFLGPVGVSARTSFDGQMSHDKMFTVETQTTDYGYALSVMTREIYIEREVRP